MTKKLAIITYYTESALLYSQQLKYLFGNHLDIQTYSFDRSNMKEIKADVVLASTYSIYGVIKKYIKNYSQILIANITLTKEGLAKVQNIPKGTTAMLVNSGAEMALDTISMIYQAGLTHVELVPVYPGIEDVPNLNIAITPGEASLVPDGVANVVDIGHRVLDLSTIVDIAVKLDLDYLLQKGNIRNFFKNNITNNFGIKNLLNKTDQLESHMELLLNVMDQGIIGVNQTDCIYIYSQAAEKITGLKKEDVLGQRAKTLFPSLNFWQVLKTSKSIEGKIIKINDHDIAVTIYPIVNIDITQSAIAIIRKFSDTEKQQHKLRAQVIKKGYVAKYTFDHIIGKSNTIMYTKDIAVNMAKSDSTVLLYGESGTGKELFAQAIHNCSKRKRYPFIAVNCGAIPENLLESELFGYEEGAFTGAKKGGKPGYFELAHMGTLFLDEISEMALPLQTRLLRVLQEKEVIRIGGDSVIHIDVRIIAATNKKLKMLVENSKFRKDLYYRLNVLPLNIPPLRERKEDISLLMDHFKDEFNANFQLSPEVFEEISSYYWEGNIRELRNCVEYLAQTRNKLVESKDLPFYFHEISDHVKLDEFEKEILENFVKIFNHKISAYLFVLEQLKLSYFEKIHVGRRGIASIAAQKGLYLSESEIRGILTNLENYQMVEISKGRVGTKITDFGLRTIKYLKAGKMEFV
ncbi:sigma 54-interacting transcriptional regulator [Clostridiaceae bacterium 35-E11]